MQFTQCHPYRLWPCMTATMVRYLCVNDLIMYQHVSPRKQAQLAQVVALLKPHIIFIGLVCTCCCIIWYCAARVAYVVYIHALRSHVPLYLALASRNVRARFRYPRGHQVQSSGMCFLYSSNNIPSFSTCLYMIKDVLLIIVQCFSDWCAHIGTYSLSVIILNSVLVR